MCPCFPGVNVKLAVLGGGSTYTPELIDGIAREKESLRFDEVWLQDPDADRLQILTEFSQRLFAARKCNATLVSTGDLSAALAKADFVISQIRVGGQAARQKDTELGLRHDLVGQETTGCGGFACALRHIPPSVAIAHEMEKLCPDALLINFTNPAGMVTEALLKHSKVRAIGICNVPWVMVRDIAGYYQVPFESVELEYFGLNHLSWATKIKIQGEDRTQDVLNHCTAIHPERYAFPPDLIQAIGALPSPYLRYYYLTPDIIRQMKRSEKTRAQEVMEIESFLLHRYQDPKLHENPPELMKRGGIYYGEVAVNAMIALAGQTPKLQILNLSNQHVFPWLPQNAVIEFPWMVSKDKVSAGSTPDVPEAMKSLMIQVKTYEELTIQAAMTGDRKSAYQALLVNPLVGSASKAKPVLEELLRINAPYLPRFGKD